MRPIDADVLEENLSNAIAMIKSAAKALDVEDNKELQMVIRVYTDILNGVKEQPTIEPERKTGKWIRDSIATNIFWCSNCGCDAPVDPTSAEEFQSNYCYFCGADMRGEKNVD